MAYTKVLTSESVGRGHPDKVCDSISDAVLDEVLRNDPNGRVALETGVKAGFPYDDSQLRPECTMQAYKNGVVTLLGELTTTHNVDLEKVVKNAVKKIGYVYDEGFNYNCLVQKGFVSKQSPDIAQGVDSSADKEQGAGDQGLMWGYATNETPELMPLGLVLAHRLVQRLENFSRLEVLPYLRPDTKSQVAVIYENNKPVGLKNVVVAASHDKFVKMDQLQDDVLRYVIKPVCEKWLRNDTTYHINGTGRFEIHGPVGDSGVTGRKIIVDTYGGVGRHGGGAFCIAGNARVNTAIGTLKIKECKITMGNLVKTDVHPMPAGEWWDNGVKKTMLVTTVDGYNLEATPDHKIRVLDSQGNYVWKELREASVAGDFIAIQKKNRLFGNGAIGRFNYNYKDGTAEKRKKKYVFPKQLTDDYANLLGLLIGDGDCTDEGCIKICVCEEEQKKNVQQLFTRLFNDKGKVYGHWVYIGGVELRAYLELLGLKKSRSFDKDIPEAIWNGTKSNIAAFLRGLFDTDGCVRIDGRNKTSPRVHLATTSKQLAEEVQIIMLNFGIVSNISKSDSKGKISYIQGRKVTSRRALYNITIKGIESIKQFKEDIGFGLPRKGNILNKINLEEKTDRLTIPYQRERIIRLFKNLPILEQKKDSIGMARFTRKSSYKATKELTYAKLSAFIKVYDSFLKGEPEFEFLKELLLMEHYYTKISKTIPSFAQTFDLNIPLTHTFTANGFVVHNSGKDPSKVDRSAAYLARYIAKNLVAADLADICELQLSYCIGVAEPESVFVNTFGTGKYSDERLAAAVREVMPLKPAEIIKTFSLKSPQGWSYFDTAAYGHFGNDKYPWEKIDRVNDLENYLARFGSR